MEITIRTEREKRGRQEIQEILRKRKTDVKK
jgi:hypothetical protein